MEFIIPESIESRRAEFASYVLSALRNIKNFAYKNEWGDLTEEPFIERVMIFDDKREFDRNLLQLVDADPEIELPETYCAALENRVLVIVTPEIYAQVFPEGIEKDSYEKLITHEIAHRFHIRILEGNEEGMGPVWFYEGFAIYVANQFGSSKLQLSREKMVDIMTNPARGSYQNYGYIFRQFAEQIPIHKLIEMAKFESFNEQLISIFDLS
ncbi:MAG: hypothetical protein K0B81_09660 [Candidatus Cloacimonetes bacterium]|nr:hypothetical protein [Candidatus Cloacimonadota bacterium]